jgi:transketolase
MNNTILNKSNFKIWSRLGMRATFGVAALELVNTVEKLMILTSDVSTSAGLDRFKKKFPNNYLDVGIAEQNLIGIGAGLASEGFNVITTTFAPFQTMRCCEQIKVNLGYMKQKLCMVGLASGLVLGRLGYTHCCIEDVGILRSIPNLTIITPADSGEVVKAVIASIKQKNSVYIRLTGGANIDQIYEDDYSFEIGKSITLQKGNDISIFASGTMVKVAIDCARILSQNNIDSEVVNMHTIKPIDVDKIEESAKKTKLIVSIEDHNIIGGMGSAIAEKLVCVKNSPQQIFFGINDTYSEGGEYNFLKEKFNLTPDFISKKIISKFKNI